VVEGMVEWEGPIWGVCLVLGDFLDLLGKLNAQRR
jgi:hypothetical protein